MILSIGNLFSQNCQNLITNGDFNNTTCWTPLSNFNMKGAFDPSVDCVNDWKSDNSADLMMPNGGWGDLDGHITKPTAGLCYTEGPGHSEWIEMTHAITMYDEPHFNYTLKVDIAISCLDKTQNYTFHPISPCMFKFEYYNPMSNTYENLLEVEINELFDI